jgi:hypothetical protein
MKSDFISKRDANLDAQEENFLSKIDLHAQTIGIDPNELNDSKSIILGHRIAFTSMNSQKAQSNAAIEDNKMKRTNAINELRRISKRIKSSKNYTQAIGDDLGIVGSEILVKNTSDLKPELKAVLNGQDIVIRFKKEGTDGIKLFSRKGEETEFSFLSFDTHSPYIDNREKVDPTKPEQREFYAYFFESDIEIGLRSDIIKVVVP